MSFLPDNIADWLVRLGEGAVKAFGSPAPVVELTPDPSRKGALALVRDGYKLQALPGAEEYQRTHRFDDLVGLAEWLERHAKPAQTEILFQTDGTVRAALTPKDRQGDVVTCVLRLHPRLERWRLLLGKKLDQRQLHRHVVSSLEDFPQALSKDGVALGSSGAPLADALTKLSVKRDGEVSFEVDHLGYTKFSGGNAKTSVQGSLPPHFTIRVPWFIGADPVAAYDLQVHLSVDPSDGGLAFELQIPSLDVVKHWATLEAARFLREQLGEDWLVGLGTLGLSSVPARS